MLSLSAATDSGFTRFFLGLVGHRRTSYAARDRWFVEAVWLVQESQDYLFGEELMSFCYGTLRVSLFRLIEDWNDAGLQRLKQILRTSIVARVLEKICEGSFRLVE